MSAAAEVLALIGSSWKSQAIRAAADLGLADVLADGPRDAATLAARTGTHAPSLARLLVALASLGLVRAEPAGLWALTATGAMLRSDTPDSLRAWARWWGGFPWAAWGGLTDSVRTGESARERLTGLAGYGFLNADPASAAVFHAAMVDLTRLVASELLRVHDFSGVRSVVDIGGGRGELLLAVLRAHPNVRGTLHDLPGVVDEGLAAMALAGVAHRCTAVGGDFFDDVPSGADRYLLKSVLHNWDDERCAILLERCRAAAPAHARLLVIERTLPATIEDTPAVHAVVQSDLNMLVGPGGRERTTDEIATLLAAAGFEVAGSSPLSTGHTAIEAVPQRRAGG